MPTYEYLCKGCGHRFERFQRISDRPVRKCPSCGEPEAQRQISAGGGLVFKGPGFYATDYRSSAPAKKDGSPSSDGDRGGKAGDPGEAGTKEGGGAESARPGGGAPAEDG